MTLLIFSKNFSYYEIHGSLVTWYWRYFGFYLLFLENLFKIVFGPNDCITFQIFFLIRAFGKQMLREILLGPCAFSGFGIILFFFKLPLWSLSLSDNVKCSELHTWNVGGGHFPSTSTSPPELNFCVFRRKTQLLGKCL